MAEYIERGKLKQGILEDALNKLSCWNSSLMELIMTDIEECPAADVAPVVHGRWETNSDRPDSLICSVCKCGFDMWKHDPHNYCPKDDSVSMNEFQSKYEIIEVEGKIYTVRECVE